MKNLIRTLTYVSLSWLAVGCQTNSNPEQPTSYSPDYFVIGSYNESVKEGVYLVEFDTTANTLTTVKPVADAWNPSYLAFGSEESRLVAATNRKTGGISTFSWDKNAQVYNLSDKIDGVGKGACHIAFNPVTGQAAIANYGSGDVYLFDVDSVSQQLTQVGLFENEGSSVTSRQRAPHMHYVQWGNNGQYLYAVDLGTDEVKVFDSSSSSFKPKVAYKLEAGDGPRHMVFHPSLATAYILNELSNTVVGVTIDNDSGELASLQRLSAVQLDSDKTNYASAIRISADGRFLYAAIRGINQISVFAVDKNGMLSPIQSISVEGDWPRDFNFSAKQDYLLIANQNSNNLALLKRDESTGMLSSTGLSLELLSPSFVSAFDAERVGYSKK